MNTSTQQVRLLVIDAEQEGQRIDNYLKTQLKGVPKSLIYRILRKGEVRVNKKRIKPEYKLIAGDEVRIPPVRVAEANELPSAKLSSIQALAALILFEDDALIVLNKPAGMAVHGGSGLSFGVIEGLRALRPEARFLELVHRLDRDTSGCLLIAKKRSALKNLHEQLRLKTMRKQYCALVRGQWQPHVKVVNAPLRKMFCSRESGLSGSIRKENLQKLAFIYCSVLPRRLWWKPARLPGALTRSGCIRLMPVIPSLVMINMGMRPLIARCANKGWVACFSMPCV